MNVVSKLFLSTNKIRLKTTFRRVFYPVEKSSREAKIFVVRAYILTKGQFNA
jgi:hypothetical protein